MAELKQETKPLSRSEREAQIKDKAGWVIVVFAALLAINTYMAGGNSSKVLNNTIEANNTYAFYQAKSIKQSIAEGQLEDAIARKDGKKMSELKEKIARYESEPATGEGKKELMKKARTLEISRDELKKHTPWLTFAGTTYQFCLVLLAASILTVSMPMFWSSLAVGALGTFLMSQGIWLWIPFTTL